MHPAGYRRKHQSSLSRDRTSPVLAERLWKMRQQLYATPRDLGRQHAHEIIPPAGQVIQSALFLNRIPIDPPSELGAEVSVAEYTNPVSLSRYLVENRCGNSSARAPVCREMPPKGDPYCAWQRGCNENLNGLVRQYFPKDIDFRAITGAEL